MTNELPDLAIFPHEEDAERAKEDYQNLRVAVVSLGQKNDQEIANLARQGLQLDNGTLMAIKLDVLLDQILGPSPYKGDDVEVSQERLDFEYKVQTRYEEMFNDLKRQVRQHVLLQGVNGVKLQP
jgi:hypothetical protein